MEEMKIETLDCVTFEPENPATRSIIWLHGLGADGHDFAPIVPQLQLLNEMNIRFIFPHAPIRPVTMNNGYEMRAWFDIHGLNESAKVDRAGIQLAIMQINVMIQLEIERGVPSNKIILAGFSQGAITALLTGLSYDKPLGGIMALSGFLPDPSSIIKDISPQNKMTPIFMAHGTEDFVVPFVLGDATHAAFKKAGFNIDWHTYNMAHSVCADEIGDIRKWLQKVLA